MSDHVRPCERPVGFTTRTAVPDDWVAYRDLRLAALRQDPLAFGSTLDRELTFDQLQWRSRLSDGSAEAPSRTRLALGPDGQFVGLLVGARFERRFQLFAMWVDPAWRSRGIGGRLLDDILGWISGTDATAEVRLEVNPGQTSAVRLYTSRGFYFTGSREPFGHTPGITRREMIRPAAGSKGAGGPPGAGPADPR